MEPFHFHRGYSLIELMVVLAIVGVLAVVTLTSQATFNKTFSVSNTSYDVGLAIRAAEVSGLSNRGVPVGGGIARAGYGVHFTTSTPRAFLVFADTYSPTSVACSGVPDCNTGDGLYTTSSNTSTSDTVVQNYSFGNGVKIINLCVLDSSGVGCLPGVGTIDLTFTPPNYAPLINGNVANVTACVTLRGSDGVTVSTVVVRKSGIIRANSTSCS